MTLPATIAAAQFSAHPLLASIVRLLGIGSFGTLFVGPLNAAIRT